MREYKFRAWDTETKEMSYDFLSKNWLRVCIESPYVELMQWTGLTDRNGKEIYEGDIMRGYNAFGESFAQLTVITWDKEEACWTGCDWSDLKGEEVIGNIHQNPELINS